MPNTGRGPLRIIFALTFIIWVFSTLTENIWMMERISDLLPDVVTVDQEQVQGSTEGDSALAVGC
jgi:hypothetical protein